MALTIRPLAETDHQVWRQLFQGYADFYSVPMTDDGYDCVWGWIFDPENDFWCDLISNDQGQVIGFTQYQLMHRSLGGGMTCYLSDLYVLPESRGSGAGRALIDHVLQFARDRGLPGVRWLTQDFNYPARRLYDTYARKTDFVFYNIPV